MSEAREKYYMEMNDEFTVVDKITAGNYSDELEQQKAELIKLVCSKCKIEKLCKKNNTICDNLRKYIK